MAELSKLQIRAKVMSVISVVKTASEYNESLLDKCIDELNSIDDKAALLNIFLREYIKMEEKEYTFCACILKEIIPVDIISNIVTEQIQEKTLSDEPKYKLVHLLRTAGISCDFNELPSYFDKPDEVLDLETKKLLEKAVFNPESMLDFLDFVSAVSEDDRKVLLKSLSLDYEGDILANIVYPILYSGFEDEFISEAVEILADSKSSLAIKPFKYLIETSDNNDIVNACKTGLKKLKLAGASEEKAAEYFKSAIAGSSPAEFYTTIPDGNGNQAFLISRKNSQEKYMLSAVVTNDTIGVRDTFGFYDITFEEILKVIAKFYKSDGKYKVTPEYVKLRINQAINTTISEKRNFPYEFICWLPLLSDISIPEKNIAEFLSDKIQEKQLDRDEILSVLTKEHTFRWYITENDNSNIKSIFDNLYEADECDIEKINSKIKSRLNEVFDKRTEDLWKDRLYNLSYILYTSGEEKDAEKYYAIIKNDEFFNLFKEIIVQRSIFNFAADVYAKSKETIFPVNIFKKQNSPEEEYDTKKIGSIISLLKEKWIDG